MANSGDNPVSSGLNRNVLLQSWARLSVYDQTASRLKTTFVQRRYYVIGLSLAATIASVLTGVLGESTIAVLLAIASIALPIVASFLLNDIIKFTGTTAWIKYRYIAEMMRMHILLYRMRAGEYAAGPADKMDNLLSQKLPLIRDEIKWDEIIPPDLKEPEGEKAILEAIKDANASTDDDGLSEISVENYIKWRVDKQRQWYNSKINDDFARLKFFVRWAQFFLLVGALVSALTGSSIDIRFVTLVAVTNAMSVALTSFANVGMVGKTYSIFQIASNLLGDQKIIWSSLADDPENQDPKKLAEEKVKFVQRVENVLLWEREEWYEMALQAQSTGDKMILGDLTRLTQRAKDSQDKPIR